MHFLFGLLILMGATFAAFCFIDQIPQEQGFDHPRFPKETMQQAPDGYERHRSLVGMAGAFGALTALFVGAALVLGLKPEVRLGLGRGRWAARTLLLAAVGYAALLILVVVIYWNAVEGPTSYVLGFPTSTAAMLFLLAPFPLLVVFLYAILFSQWIMSAEDERVFHDLVERRRNQRAD
ncbi:hypothetical protein OAS39_05105 [Pirellulales bacterium]|nr:hypothetical protein [Pirellulales bacterium]